MAMDVVRPLGRAGIDVAVVAQTGDPQRFSRFTRAIFEAAGSSEGHEQLVERLIEFGRQQASPPVLFYADDEPLWVVSRFRDRLREAFTFVIPDHGLVCDLVDKARFQALAERLSLPVPRARVLDAAAEHAPPADLALRFPIVVKPVNGSNRGGWTSLESRGKAHSVASAEDLRALWPRLAANRIIVLAQEMVHGHENQIVSYHAYVDDGGVVAEFTGRKIRTYPRAFGSTTALTITGDREVAEAGRSILQRLDFSGVAKLDFKRGPDGQLHLLEINPRFSLWHNAGAAAGVNIPALVHGDLTGRRRPSTVAARPGTTWVKLWRDPAAVREDRTSLRRWMRWVVSADTTSLLAWDDPMPFLRGMVWRRAKSRFIAPFVTPP